MNIFRETAKTVGSKGISVFCGLMSGMITARWLGPDDRGVFAIMTSIVPTLWIMVNLGTNQASIYYINKNSHEAKAIASNCFVIPIILVFSFIALAWSTKDYLFLVWLPLLSTKHLLLSLLPAPFLLLQDCFVGILRSFEKFNLLNFRQILRSVVGLIVVFLALVLLDTDLIILFISLVVLDSLLSIWMVFETIKICTIKIDLISLVVLKDLGKFGVKSYIQNALAYLHNRIDMYMIAYFITPSDVAFYDIAVIVAELLLFIPQSIAFVILPKLIRQSGVEKCQLNVILLRASFLITILLGMFFVCFGYYMILFVYGVQYVTAFKLLLVLLPGLIMSSFNGLTIPFFTSRDRQMLTATIGFISLISNVMLNLIFIPTYGALGAAMVTTITYSMFSLSLLFLYRRDHKFSINEILVPQKADLIFIKNQILSFLLQKK